MADAVKNKKNFYIPNPFEASALKELKQPWRFYSDKAEFDDVVSKYKKTPITTPNGEVNAWLAARVNTVISLGAQISDYKEETIEKAENAIRSDKNLWSKFQAMHLYNSTGLKPEIKSVDEVENPSTILQKINSHIDTIENGTFVDGKYVPSKEEKLLIRTLRNYSLFVRNPTPENEADFHNKIKNAFAKIIKRDNYLVPTKRKDPKTVSPRKNRKEKNMSDTAEFTLTDEQKDKLAELGIKAEDIKSTEDYNNAVTKAEGNSQQTGDNTNSAENDNGNDTNDNSASKPLTVSIDQPNPQDKNDQNVPEWVAKKAEYYEKLAADGKIKDYEQDKTKEGFAAKFENAEIHYSSPDNVTVSPDAGFKVFDAMFKEPDNQGRPIEFPENASKEVATRMYAACVLNGNPMQGAVPKEIDMDELAKCGLSKEQFEQVKQFYEKNQQQQSQNNANAAPEKQISAKAQEDIKKLTEIRNNFNQMKQDGKIAVQKDEHGKPQIVAGEKGTDEDVKAATAIMKEAADLVKAGLETNRDGNVKLNTQEQRDTNEALRQQQIENIRAHLSPEEQQSHQDILEKRDKVMAKRLGMNTGEDKVTDRKGNEVTAKTGDDLKKYQAQISPETMARLKGKFGNSK